MRGELRRAPLQRRAVASVWVLKLRQRMRRQQAKRECLQLEGLACKSIWLGTNTFQNFDVRIVNIINRDNLSTTF